MLLDKLNSSSERSWELNTNAETHGNSYWKKQGSAPADVQPSLYASSITSLKPIEATNQAVQNEQLHGEKNKKALSWMENLRNTLMGYLGAPQKKAFVPALEAQQKMKISLESTTQACALEEFKNRSSAIHKQPETIKIEALGKQKKGFLYQLGDWIKEKWSFFSGSSKGSKPAEKIMEREYSSPAKPLARPSFKEIDEDFKYVDITVMDPLKAMLAILVKQGELRQEQATLINQQILHRQQDLKALHAERMQIQAELALIGKRSGVLEKVSVGLTVTQALGGIASAAMVVATAATIATGGAAAPLMFVTGVFNGMAGAGQAFNTWLKGDTKDKLNKLQGELLARTSQRDEYQFQLKVDVQEIKKALVSLISHAEMGSGLLSAQYGK
ncbi:MULTISPECIES: hypothetical protein [unclassified Neochlamydia]|uniref:hypothetical protein n=1 Tax=unclassified Neochlamydia TaxID=2643326 RepID=UPI001BCA557E|nr:MULTISPECIES: hypothetical protein [unclassified Neochlamydia]MBS4171561.1 Uncharacterized protein [Neochlamydia sp. AcF95]